MLKPCIYEVEIMNMWAAERYHNLNVEIMKMWAAVRYHNLNASSCEVSQFKCWNPLNGDQDIITEGTLNVVFDPAH